MTSKQREIGKAIEDYHTARDVDRALSLSPLFRLIFSRPDGQSFSTQDEYLLRRETQRPQEPNPPS